MPSTDYKKDARLRRVDVIDVPITAVNIDDCLAFLEEHITDVRGEYVCVSNAHTCVMAHDDPSYWSVQAGSLMALPDGKPLSIIGKREVESMGRVTGPDLMRKLFAVSAEKGWRHFFYGSEQETLDELSSALSSEYPGLEIVGMEPSVFRPLTAQEKDELAGRIADSGADFVWIGLGAPRQEVLCSELHGKTPSLLIGVGGAFKVLAGVIPEAPSWMQALSLEWLYRLLQEPQRLFKRYLVTNWKFLLYQFTGTKRMKGTDREQKF